MSSARRYQEDIRRIVGLQDETRGLDEDVPRMRIGGQRGIWQIGSNDLKTGNSGSTDTEDPENQEETEEPVTPDEDDVNQNGDGSGDGGESTDPSNPIEPEVINPENPPAGVDVNSDTFGSNWASGGPKSFVDCDSNKCIELVETGGYVPPEGWDNPDTGPINEGYQVGSFWDSGQYDIESSTPAGIMRQLPNPFPPSNGNYRNYYISDRGFTDGKLTFVRFGYETNAGFTLTNHSTASLFSCGGSTIGVCSTDDPDITPSTWPKDNCIQLSPNNDGNWAASPMENHADMTAKYSEAKSILNVCNSSGEPIDIYQRVGGGHVFFNQTQGIWAGSDSSGRIRSFGSSSTLDQEIARPNN